MTSQDKKKIYKDVAELHLEGLKYGFLPTLGINFLMLMYKCIDEAEDTTLITMYDKDILQGFIAGSLGKRSTYK